MTTTTKSTSSSTSSGMTLKEFKQELIDYGRTCIPEELRHLIRIPGSSESKNMYLMNTETQETLDLLKIKFGRDSIRTQIANNVDLEYLEPLLAFEFDISDNSKTIAELLPNRDKTMLLSVEKRKVKNNIQAAILDVKTSIYQLIKASKSESNKESQSQEARTFRLSQAARKLNVGTQYIVDLLREQGVRIESSPNSKITLEQYDQLAKYINAGRAIKENTPSDSNKDSSVSNKIGIEQFKINSITNQKRSFFVAGHDWDNVDQLPRFIENSIWENGHEDKQTSAVNSVNLGDVIFAKTTWVKGKSQGMLTLRAIGVVLDNQKDGHNLRVNWFSFPERLDLNIGSQYRRTFQKISENYLDEILDTVLRAYENLPEIVNSLSYLAEVGEDSAIGYLIRSKISSGANFWWLNAGRDWTIDDLQVGDQESYGARDPKGKYHPYVKDLETHDFLIGYQIGPKSSIIGLFAITQKLNDEKGFSFELLYKFRKSTPYEELRQLPLFSKSSLSKNIQGSLHKLEVDLFEEIINSTEIELPLITEAKSKTGEIKNTAIDNDGAYTSKDLLEIENDVRSFALLLASKDIKPPLAVALFGKWGSGKSFFMNHLSKRVEQLSIHQSFLSSPETEKQEGNEEPFCKGIAQIEFNAWSYLDSNLWAGLISSIFEKLDEYISSRGKGDVQKLKIRKKLSEKLHVLSSEQKIITDKKEDLITEKKQLETKLIFLKQNEKTLINQVTQKKLGDLINEVKRSVNLEEKVKKDLEAYGITQERISDINPNALYDEVNSWVTFLRSLGSISAKGILIGSISVLVLLFVWIDPYSLASNFLKDAGREITAIISIAGPLFAKWHSSFMRFKKLVKPILDYKNDFNKQLEEAKFKYQQEIDLLEISLNRNENEIISAQQELNSITKKIEDVEFTLEHFVAQRAFNNFIKRRIKDEQYDKHLGLISIIRRDFETLSDLFINIEIDKTVSKENIQLQEKKKIEHDEFSKLFKDEKVLDRIILYIDDLDRCSDEKVLEVIQAVHLLMAFPLFNVVVGVDKRCVRNALLLKTKLQYRKIAPINEIEEMGIEMITPGEYLEKIFQIPFELKDPENSDVQKLVHHLLEKQILIPEKEARKDEEGTENHDDDKESANNEKQADQEEINLVTLLLQEQARKHRLAENKSLVSSAPEDLKLSESEFKQIKEIVFLVGNTPRTIKRFINIYRIIRAYKRPETNGDLTNEDHLAIMFLLAIGIGDRKEIADKFYKLVRANSTRVVSEYFKEIEELLVLEKVILGNEIIRDTLNLKGDLLLKHIPFVSRFSFGREVETITETETNNA